MASVELPSAPTGPPPAKKPKTDLNCEQCGLVKSKYTCPKCAFRTCSLPCVKLHKESASCDGQRQPFEAVKKYSQFDDNVSVKDQTFLQNVKEAVSNGIRRTAPIKPPIAAIQSPTVANGTPATTVNSLFEAAVNETSEAAIVEPVAPVIADTSAETQVKDVVVKEELAVPQEHSQPETVASDAAPAEEQVSRKRRHPGDEEVEEESDFLKKHGHGPTDPNALTAVERYLISNVTRRRIFITVNSPAESDGSRHEQFSDTIYWTIGLNFLREAPKTTSTGETPVEGAPMFELDDAGDEYEVDAATNTSVKKGLRVESYNCKARNIPESLTVKTLIRQFVVPKLRGVVVNKSELDETAMTPFWEAGLDGVLVYMRVPVGQLERYYVVDMSKTILDNLRNRYVHGHPTFLVVLPKQFTHWKPLSEMEAQELHEERRIKNRERHQNDPRRGGGHRGGRGGGGGGRGGGGFRGGRGGGGGHRGGRGGRGGGHRGGRGGGNNHRDNLAPYDLSSIFEPFPEGPRPNRRPDYHANEDRAQSGWANAVKSFNRQPKKEEPSD